MITTKHKLSPFSALKFRDFRLLWISFLISRIGSEMQVVAINWHMYSLTGSPLSLGLIGLARFIPVLIFSIFAGITADILDRKKLMIAAQIMMIFSSVTLAVATFGHFISPMLIYATIAFSSVASAFDTPARHAIVPHLVPKKYFMNAVSLNTILWQSAILIGPSIGGFTIAMLGEGYIYAFNAITFIAVILALLLISPIVKTVEKNTSFNVASIRTGFTFVVRHPIILSTMLLDFFATFFSSATVLLPIFAKDILMVGPQGLGILYAAPSIGAVTAGLITSSFGHFKRQGKILLSAVFLYGLATLLFGLTRSFYPALLFLALTGIGDIVSTIIRNTIRQLSTPDYLRGRMVAVNMIFFQGGPQLGEAEAGILAALWGTPASVVIGGAGTMLATILIAVLVPKLRKYQGNELAV